MRRAVLALATGAALLAPVACGAAKSPSVDGPTAVTATTSPETKAVCEALSLVYSKDLGPFAAALSEMVADRKATPSVAKASQDQAQQKLGALATDVRRASQSSTDPQLRTDGARTAEQLRAKSVDHKFFGAIQTPADVDTTLGPTMKQWLAPAAGHCS